MPAGATNRPGAARPGVGAPGGGTGARPGVSASGNAGAMRPGMADQSPSAASAYANRPYGTYHTPAANLADQGAAVRSQANALPNYNPSAYAANPNAWQPRNLANGSLYANPGYGAVAAFAGLGQQAQPYDYGGNVVVQPQAVYVNGDNAGTPQQYADQAGQIAANGSNDPGQESSWQPLGVFAMVEGGQTTSDDTFQLAINQKGLLRGNYHNLKDNSVVAIAGSVDPKTQRAAWTIGGDKTPTYETGVANLTGNEGTMILHTPDGQVRQFALVRLDPPAQ
jgi:hypothetical protein